VTGLLIWKGMLFEAGCVLLFSGLLDLLDGAVARVSGAASNPFGGILDSTLDRYGDAFVFVGLIFYLFERAAVGYAALAMSALAGSFVISYVRARSESAGRPCRVGYWERGERLVFVSLGLILANLPAVLWVLGTLTHATVLYRLACGKDPSSSIPAGPGFFMRSKRLFFSSSCSSSALLYSQAEFRPKKT